MHRPAYLCTPATVQRRESSGATYTHTQDPTRTGSGILTHRGRTRFIDENLQSAYLGEEG